MKVVSFILEAKFIVISEHEVSCYKPPFFEKTCFLVHRSNHFYEASLAASSTAEEVESILSSDYGPLFIEIDYAAN